MNKNVTLCCVYNQIGPLDVNLTSKSNDNVINPKGIFANVLRQMFGQNSTSASKW